MHATEINQLLPALDLKNAANARQFVFGQEIDIILTFPIPPAAEERPVARLGELRLKIALQRKSAERLVVVACSMSLRDVLPRAMARHNGKLRHFTASAANLPQQGDLPFSIEELHAHDLK